MINTLPYIIKKLRDPLYDRETMIQFTGIDLWAEEQAETRKRFKALTNHPNFQGRAFMSNDRVDIRTFHRFLKHHHLIPAKWAAIQNATDTDSWNRTLRAVKYSCSSDSNLGYHEVLPGLYQDDETNLRRLMMLPTIEEEPSIVTARNKVLREFGINIEILEAVNSPGMFAEAYDVVTDEPITLFNSVEVHLFEDLFFPGQHVSLQTWEKCEEWLKSCVWPTDVMMARQMENKRLKKLEKGG